MQWRPTEILCAAICRRGHAGRGAGGAAGQRGRRAGAVRLDRSWLPPADRLGRVLQRVIRANATPGRWRRATSCSRRKRGRTCCASTSWVNDTIKPITDLEHWGVVERWNYPDDGYGDCEDYVLLKRRLLMQAGWPRQALLITVVRDKRGDGHAVLTVKTDKGEFILDNQNEDVLLWSETGYRFVKRQSQTDPNALGRARRSAAGARHRHAHADCCQSETRSYATRSRPHPSPSPDRARARPALPRSRPHLFHLEKLATATLCGSPGRLISAVHARHIEPPDTFRIRTLAFSEWDLLQIFMVPKSGDWPTVSLGMR